MNRKPDNRIKVTLDGVRYNLGDHDEPGHMVGSIFARHTVTRDFTRFAEAAPDPLDRERLAALFRTEAKFKRREFITKVPVEPPPEPKNYLVIHLETGHYRLSTPKRYTSQIDDAARFRESEARELCATNPHYVMRPAP